MLWGSSARRVGPWLRVGSPGPSAVSGLRLLTAQTLAAGNDPGPGRERLRIDGVGVFSSGGAFGQIHFGVGCDLIIRGLPRSLTHPSHPVRVGPAPGHWSGPAWAATGRVRVIRVTRVGPAQASGPGLQAPAWRIRVAGLCGVSGGAPRRRPVCRLHPPRPARRRGCPTRAGPAGRPEHH